MKDFLLPEDLRYTADHEWIKAQGDFAVVGLTAFACDQLGDITYVELPEPEDELEQMDSMCVVESVKAAADVYAPVKGRVAEVNPELEEQPELVTKDCYGQGWLVKLQDFDQAQLDGLMDAAAYRETLASGE